MASRKKYIHVLFVLSISLYSLPVMSAEFMYGAIPTQEVAETTKDFSKIAFENPALVITPLMACVVGGMYLKRNTIHSAFSSQYKDMLCKAAEKTDKAIPIPVKFALTALKPVTGGVSNYIDHNKFHMAFACIVSCAGYLVNYPGLSGIISGMTLMVGYFTQGLSGVRKDMAAGFNAAQEDRDKKFNVISGQVGLLFIQNVATLLEIASVKTGVKRVQETLDIVRTEAETNHENALAHLDETRKELLDQFHHECSVAGDNVTKNVNAHVDEKLVELFAEISSLTKKCVDLSNGVNKVGQGNTVVTQAIEGLEDQLLKMREDFFSVLAESVVKMDASTQESAKMLKKIGSMGEAQDAKIASLIVEITNNNLLLDSLSKIQSESGQALTTLQENSAKHSDLLQKLFARQDESDLLFSKKISSLQKQNETFETSLNASLDILSQRLRALEDNQTEMKDLVIQTNLEVKLNAKNQEEQFQVNQALFRQQTQENQILHQEISELKTIAAQQTNRIKTLEDLVGKLLKKSSKIKQDVKETKRNTQDHKDTLEKILHHVAPQYPSLQQEEQAAINNGWAVPVNKGFSHPQLSFNLDKPKAFQSSERKPAQSFFSALTYNPTGS